MQTIIQDYSKFETADFLFDDNFKDWVKYPDEDNSVYWNNVLLNYPEKAKYMELASEVVIALKSQNLVVNTEGKIRVWENISKELKYKKQPKIIYIYWWRNIAASVALLLLVGLSYYLFINTEKSYSTLPGANKEVNLPDESRIILNGNSSISYSRSWDLKQTREVKIDGEAFFNVKHVAVKGRLSKIDSFRVIVNGLKATVLGTEFNIKNRRGVTEIVLKNGSLRVDFIKKEIKSVILKPGDKLTYSSSGNAKLSNTNSAVATAWTHQSLIFEGTTVADIIKELEDNFGYKVILKDPSLAKRRITGTVPIKRVDDLIFVLSNILNITIEKTDKTIIFNALH